MNDIARCVADLDEMTEVDAPFRDARLDHLAGLGERGLSCILDPVELFAFLVESVEVLCRSNRIAARERKRGGAIWLQKMILV